MLCGPETLTGGCVDGGVIPGGRSLDKGVSQLVCAAAAWNFVGPIVVSYAVTNGVSCDVARLLSGSNESVGFSCGQKFMGRQWRYEPTLRRVRRSSWRSSSRGCSTLQASLSGTFLQTLPDLVTPLKGHHLSPCSCPPTRSAPSERFGY